MMLESPWNVSLLTLSLLLLLPAHKSPGLPGRRHDNTLERRQEVSTLANIVQGQLHYTPPGHGGPASILTEEEKEPELYL